MAHSSPRHKQKKGSSSSKTVSSDEESNSSSNSAHLSPRKKTKYKIALVCDWLTTPGGAEKVLLEFHHLYPDAPIYTSQYSKKGINWFNDADVRTGWMQTFPKSLRKFLGLFRQIYFSHLDLSDYDLVISVTGAEAKSVKTKKEPTKQTPSSNYITHDEKSQEKNASDAFHLCYCHVPTQYYWQMYDKYVENPGFGILNPLVRLAFKLLVRPLRQADFRAAQQPDQFITISDYARGQIAEYYHRDAIIIPPPVETDKFAPTHSTPQKPDPELLTFLQKSPQEYARGYFVISCRQVTWKRVDLAIKACLSAHVPLLVIGDGPEHANLVKLAATYQPPAKTIPNHQAPESSSDLIKFLPWTPADQLATYLQNARAYLFPSLEPFGIAAVEALAAGCPVIAYAEGGSRDFVKNHKNGLLFTEQTPESLATAIQAFEQLKFDRAKVSASAAQFSTANFDQKIQNLIAKIRKENI